MGTLSWHLREAGWNSCIPEGAGNELGLRGMDTPLRYPLDFFVIFYAVQTRTNGQTHFPGCAMTGVAMGQGFLWMKSNLLCRYQCWHRADSLDV